MDSGQLFPAGGGRAEDKYLHPLDQVLVQINTGAVEIQGSALEPDGSAVSGS